MHESPPKNVAGDIKPPHTKWKPSLTRKINLVLFRTLSSTFDDIHAPVNIGIFCFKGCIKSKSFSRYEFEDFSIYTYNSLELLS